MDDRVAKIIRRSFPETGMHLRIKLVCTYDKTGMHLRIKLVCTYYSYSTLPVT